MACPTADLPRAHGGPPGTGVAKAEPDDFMVEEILGFEPSGEGEHALLQVEKRGENTEYIARRLARHAGVPVRNVGYAGLKDRHGRTVQWFSVQLPGQTGPDWRELESDSLRILQVARNHRKLRKGAATGNRFAITVRELRADRERLAQTLGRIAGLGLPNYFGPQRFGHDGKNLVRAHELFEGQLARVNPHQRGIYLSAARAELFNRILALRVAQGRWDQAVDGDAFMFQGSHSFFHPDALTPDILQRVAASSIHPSGTLWGKGIRAVTGAALAAEDEAVAGTEAFCHGLEQFGLETSQRPLRVCPEELQWDFAEPDTLSLRFVLPAGAYATALLREVISTVLVDD